MIRRKYIFSLDDQFLVRAPDSRNAGVSASATGGAANSFGEHASMGKGTCMYDGSKELQ